MGQKKKPFRLTQLLFFGFSPLRRTEVEKIHRYYGKYYWNRARRKEKYGLVKRFLLSPIIIGKEIHRTINHKPGWKSIIHRFYLALFYDITGKDYDLLGFGEKNNRGLKKYYLQERTLKYSLYKLLRQYGKRLYPPAEKVSLGDKEEFYRFCCREGIPTVPLLDPLKPLPKKDLFIKPRVGKEGRGSEVWYYKNGYYKRSDGLKRSPAELHKEVSGYSEGLQENGMIIQPLMRPHKDLQVFYNRATPTIRILTYTDLKGRVTIGPSMIRYNLKEAAITDNASTGGEVAPIHIAEGTVEKPHLLQIPFWQESCEMVTLAHEKMKDRILIGWDILVTDNGPLMLEGNSQAGLTHIQKAHGMDFGKDPMIKELRIHIKNALEILE